jgi:hypothetical protein
MSQTCPWDAFDPGSVAFCEERLCAWIVEPSNAWSSVGYLLVAFWLYSRDARGSRDPVRYAVVVGTALTGLGSFAFHGTGTAWGELLDQLGMFVLSALVLAFVFGRRRGLSNAATTTVYAGLVAVSTLVQLVAPSLGIPLFALQLVVGLGWELYSRSHAVDTSPWKPLAQAIGILLVSFGIWLTDITGLVCEPTNHLVTGHAVWHVLNATCLLYLYRFYRSPPG